MSIQDITIVITSFKSDERIENCLNSIDRSCKVIVVENSSDNEDTNSENESSDGEDGNSEDKE